MDPALKSPYHRVSIVSFSLVSWKTFHKRLEESESGGTILSEQLGRIADSVERRKSTLAKNLNWAGTKTFSDWSLSVVRAALFVYFLNALSMAPLANCCRTLAIR